MLKSLWLVAALAGLCVALTASDGGAGEKDKVAGPGSTDTSDRALCW